MKYLKLKLKRKLKCQAFTSNGEKIFKEEMIGNEVEVNTIVEDEMNYLELIKSWNNQVWSYTFVSVQRYEPKYGEFIHDTTRSGYRIKDNNLSIENYFN